MIFPAAPQHVFSWCFNQEHCLQGPNEARISPATENHQGSIFGLSEQRTSHGTPNAVITKRESRIFRLQW